MAEVPDTWIQSSRSSKCTPQLAIQLLEGSNPNQVGATNYSGGFEVYANGAYLATSDVFDNHY